jgi:hypothetical protein
MHFSVDDATLNYNHELNYKKMKAVSKQVQGDGHAVRQLADSASHTIV